MKFQAEISKIFNKFHFTSNLTEWHFSTRKNCNKRWIKLTGPLNKQEKESIKKFTKILNKYNFGERFIGRSFVVKNENDVWKNLNARLTEKEFDEVKDIFSVFDRRFDKIWRKEKKNLSDGSKKLREQLNNKKIAKIIRMASNFLKCDKLPRSIMIYPLLGHPDSMGGGANIGIDKMTIEYHSLRKRNQVDRIIRVILHETFHLMAKNSKYYQKNINRTSALIDQKFGQVLKGKGMSGYVIANEAIINSLLPYGYLRKYLFKTSDEKLLKIIEEKLINTRSDYYKWTCFAVKNLYYKTKEYFERKKPIDKHFFDNIEIILKKFLVT